MKKNIFILISCFFCMELIAQSNDSLPVLKGRMGPSIVHVDSLIEKGAILMLNNVIISEKDKIVLFFKKYRDIFGKGKFYESEEAKRKWKIKTKAGLFYYKIKRKIIDLRDA